MEEEVPSGFYVNGESSASCVVRSIEIKTSMSVLLFFYLNIGSTPPLSSILSCPRTSFQKFSLEHYYSRF